MPPPTGRPLAAGEPTPIPVLRFMSKNPRKRTDLLDILAECSCDRVPDEEVEACFYYEYARESKSLRRAALTRFRHVSIFKLTLASAVKGFGFPSPWLRLPNDERQELGFRIPDVMNAMDRKQVANIVINPDLSRLPDSRAWFFEIVAPLGATVVRSGAFAVNLAAGAPAIGRFFERWAAREIRQIKAAEELGLKFFSVTKRGGETKKEPIFVPTEGFYLSALPFRIPGPSGHRSALRCLGALRWRYFCLQRRRSFATALGDPELRSARPEYFKHASDFNRACRKAVTTFRELFPGPAVSAEGAKPELPIHFSANWSDKPGS